MTVARPVIASPVMAGLPQASEVYSERRKAYRLAICGDSTAAADHGTRWSGLPAEWFPRSDAPGHADSDIGTLTTYSDGTATWQAAGDTVGPAVAAGNGFVWMESGSAGKGFCFNIVAADIAASSPTGTAHSITVMAGSPTGAIGYYSGSAALWSQMLQGFTLDITGVLGTPGVTTADLLARTGNVRSVDTHGRQLVTQPDAIYASIGINDCSALAAGGAGFTLQDVLDNLTAIKDDSISEGQCIIFGSLSHESPGDRKAYMDAVNAHFAAMAAAQPNCVHFADYRPYIDDPVTGAALPGYMSGAHYNAGYGAYYVGTVLRTLLQGLVGPAQGRSKWRSAYAPTLLDDVDWTVLEGTGIIPFGDVSVAVSTEAVAGEADWKVLTVTGGTGDSYVIASKPLVSMPDKLRAECELYVSDLSKVGGGLLQGPRLVFAFFDGSDTLLEYSAGITMVGNDLADDVSVLMRTDAITPPAGAVRAELWLAFYVAAGNNSVIKIRYEGAEEAVV